MSKPAFPANFREQVEGRDLEGRIEPQRAAAMGGVDGLVWVSDWRTGLLGKSKQSGKQSGGRRLVRESHCPVNAAYRFKDRRDARARSKACLSSEIAYFELKTWFGARVRNPVVPSGMSTVRMSRETKV